MLGGVDCRTSPGGVDRNDDVRAGRYEFGGQRGKTIVFPLCRSNQESQIPSFLLAELPQGLEEDWVSGVVAVRSQNGHRLHTRRRRLRSGEEQQSDQHGRHPTNPPHVCPDS